PQSLLPTADLQHDIARRLEDLSHSAPHGGFVVHHQDGFLTARRLCPSHAHRSPLHALLQPRVEVMGDPARHSPHSLHCCVRFPCDHVDALCVLSCHGSPPFPPLIFSFMGKNALTTQLYSDWTRGTRR